MLIIRLVRSPSGRMRFCFIVNSFLHSAESLINPFPVGHFPSVHLLFKIEYIPTPFFVNIIKPMIRIQLSSQGVRMNTHGLYVVNAEEKKENFRDFLTEIKESQDLSERALSRLLSIPVASLRTYLDCTVYPSEGTRRNIARKLGISYDELMNRIEGVPLPQSRPIEELCADIRSLSQSDFLIVLETVCNRVRSSLEAQLPPASSDNPDG